MIRRSQKRMILILALAGIAAGLTCVWLVYIESRYSVQLSPRGELTVSRRTAANEQPPTVRQKEEYAVAAEAPRFLRISSIGVDARIVPVGKDAAGQIGAPTGIWDVGWYSASNRPGESGVSFIDGHISGPTLPAVFKDLHTLKMHDSIAIERGDGVRLQYQVESVAVRQLTDIDMDALLKTAVNGKPTLVLMTCGGEFNEQAYTYDQRVVVISTLL